MMAALLFVGLGALAEAQPAGRLAGSVHDQTGGALAGVTIVIAGPVAAETQTETSGRFEFRGLPPGTYALTASRNGFEPADRVVQLAQEETLSISLILVIAVLEETVVTATKAGEGSTQSVPAAISALSSAELTRFETRTIDQAAGLAPSVTFTQNGTFGQLSIRGIGTNAVNAGGDPSSAMYLDGVYLARPAMAFVDFLDLERIEVLRGPQGTLYGRNAVGGAVNLVSNVPTNDFRAAARLSTGAMDELRVEARASGALRRDRVMGSVAFARGTRDGYVRDLDHPNHPLGGDDLTAARGQLRVVLGPRTDVLVSSDVTDQDGTLLTFNKVLQAKPGFTVDNPPDLHEVRTSTPATSSLLNYGVAARLTSALTPSTTLTSLTAFRWLDNEFVVDADITEVHLLATHNHERQHQVSQELTIARQQARLAWVGGLFLFSEADHQSLWVDQFQAGAQVQLHPRVDATSGALFGQATIGLTPRLSATAGLRYTRERKEIDNSGGRYGVESPTTAVPGSEYAYSDAIRHAAWTPKVGVELKLAPDAMAYVSATRGFKSGGFNPSSTQAGRGYAPEWAWSYEGGLKTHMMNGRTRLNVAVFDMDYTNLQVQTPIGIGVFDIRNAAAATIRGVEVEAASRVAGGLEAGGHLTWLDATYDEYVAVAFNGTTGDVAGKRLNNAPEWAGRVWMEWNGSVGRSRLLTVTADATAQSTVFYTPFNDDVQRQRPYGLLGARVEYGPSHRRWSINAYARNLTDTDYIMATFGTVPTAFGGRPGQSRQVSVQLQVRR